MKTFLHYTVFQFAFMYEVEIFTKYGAKKAGVGKGEVMFLPDPLDGDLN